ncbi:MAG: hypothetical protein ACP5SI_06120 [Chloroflexia bacterium]
MSAAQVLLRWLLFPGGVGALLLGVLARGSAAWLGARLRKRPAPPVWEPLMDLVHLARKGAPEAGSPAVAWVGLVAAAGLMWAASLLPWSWGKGHPEGDFLCYVLILALPALARLLAAGFSGSVEAAWGARRQAALEVSRLLPLLWGTSVLPLATRQLRLAPDAAVTPVGTAALCLAAALFLATLPWPLWDHDRFQAPLAGVGGRWLALYRAVEALELTVQVGLVGAALRAAGLFPPEHGWAAPLVALVGAIAVLAGFEASAQELPTEAAVRRYTRWLVPAAFLAMLLALWAGR